MLRFQSETPGLLSNLADSIILAWKRRLPRYCLPSPAEVRELHRSPVDFEFIPTAPLCWYSFAKQFGNAWLWDPFIIIDAELSPAFYLVQRLRGFQDSGDPDFEFTQRGLTSRMPNFNTIYLHAFHVFWRDGLPLSGAKEYLYPSLILTVEIRALDMDAWFFGLKASGASEIWPLVGKSYTGPRLSTFLAKGRISLGPYFGPWNASAARRELFRTIRNYLRLTGNPRWLGGKYAAFGNPVTGWPHFDEVLNEKLANGNAGRSSLASEIH